MLILLRNHFVISEMNKKTYSVYLSRALDALGFSYSCIKQRQKSWEICGESLSADEEENITDLIAGSKAEGVSRMLEGDYDLMVSLNDFVCYGSVEDMENNMLTNVQVRNKDDVPNEKSHMIYSRTDYQFNEQTGKNSDDHYLTALSQSSLEPKDVKKNQIKIVDSTDKKLRQEHIYDRTSEVNDKENKQLYHDLTQYAGETNMTQNKGNTAVKYDGVFLMDTDNVSPGYTVLKVVHLDETKLLKSFTLEGKAVVYAKTEKHGESVLSSERFASKAYECDEDEDSETIAGPAGRSLANDRQGSVCDTDSVYSIPCVCKRINQAWLSRKRKFEWPSQDLVKAVSRLDGHVVPVGFKSSENRSIEWRVCYTLSEIKLVQSFNETQIKLHALLKMVGKGLLQTKCPDITSYILKNTLLWMAEKIPTEKFEIENLYALLRMALKFLTFTIHKRCSPNYMIPGRNLFLGKLPEDERIKVLEVLDELINDDYFFIERYEELEPLSKHIHIAEKGPSLVKYMELNRLQFETVFREHWREIWEDRVHNFIPVCLKECTSLKSLVILCKLLDVSSKTKEVVVEKIFWWISGRLADTNAGQYSVGYGSANPFWCWSDSGDIIRYEPRLLGVEQLNKLFNET